MLNLVYEHVVTQVQTIVMHTHCSSNSPPLPTANFSTAAASHCHCSPADEERMITFLCPKKDAAADGANFRPVVWNTLVTEMAKYHETGAPKTVKACKAKYSWVCTVLQSPDSSIFIDSILSSFRLPTTLS